MPIAFYRKYHFYARPLPTFLATDIQTIFIYICMFSLREIPFHILTNFSSSLSETNLQRKLKHSRAFIKVFSRAIN